MLVLSSVIDVAAMQVIHRVHKFFLSFSPFLSLQLQPQFPQLLNLLSSALDSTANKMVPFYALK